MKSPPYIVCAANRHRDTGLIICGARHWDSVMRAAAKAIYLRPPYPQPPYHLFDQGFIDQHGQWYSRTEAWAVAVGAGPALGADETRGQIRQRVGGDTADGGMLYSENLF